MVQKKSFVLGGSLAALVMSTVAISIALAETGKQCYVRLNCGSQATTAGCYACCNGCDSAVQVDCQDKCDGTASTPGGGEP